MPAHPAPTPVYIPMPMDICLLDEEFDVFEITRPSNRQLVIGQDIVLCDDSDWDEQLIEKGFHYD